jgi:hypothetical protein
MRFSARGLLHVLFLPLLWCLPGSPAQAEDGPALAVATDVQGTVTVSFGGATKPLTVLGELRERARVELAQGSRVVLVYLSSGKEFELSGPAAAELQPKEPHIYRGKQPVSRNLLLGDAGSTAQESLSGLAQLALVTRAPPRESGLELLAPRGTVLETRPVFRWSPWTEDTDYRFELDDARERVVHEAVLRDQTLTLPAALQPGATYSWSVEVRIPPGRRISRWATFRVASGELKSRVERLRPAADAPFSAQLIYAAWLTNMDLNALAQEYWDRLAKQRPQDPMLRRMAASGGH